MSPLPEIPAKSDRPAGHSDSLDGERRLPAVIRKAQGIVELALKGVIQAAGIEPPKIIDVGGLLVGDRDKSREAEAREIDRIGEISKRLRKEGCFLFTATLILLPRRNTIRKAPEMPSRVLIFRRKCPEGGPMISLGKTPGSAAKCPEFDISGNKQTGKHKKAFEKEIQISKG